MNGEHFQPGGPVIVVLGGDNEITPWRLFDMIPGALAKVHKGYLFYLEHRFYGKSMPTKYVCNARIVCHIIMTPLNMNIYP